MNGVMTWQNFAYLGGWVAIACGLSTLWLAHRRASWRRKVRRRLDDAHCEWKAVEPADNPEFYAVHGAISRE